MLCTMSLGAWAGALATTAFSAFPLVQRDLRAADASCSPDPLVRAALVTMQVTRTLTLPYPSPKPQSEP